MERTTEDKFRFVCGQVGNRIESVCSLPGFEGVAPAVSVYIKENYQHLTYCEYLAI